jgi:hypothetical protein
MIQKELRKVSQWFWKGFWKWYDGGGKWNHIKKDIFEVEVLFSSEKIDFPFIWRDSWRFSFPSSFFRFFLFFSFFLCSISWGLGGFDDIWGANHFFKNLFSNGMVMTMDILVMDAYFRMELCTPI